jgi:hypothetical protein
LYFHCCIQITLVFVTFVRSRYFAYLAPINAFQMNANYKFCIGKVAIILKLPIASCFRIAG